MNPRRNISKFAAMAASALLLSSFTPPVHAGDVREGNFGAKKEEKRSALKSRKSQDEVKVEQEKPSKPASDRSYPFHGILDSADEQAGLIVVRGKQKPRVIRVTRATRVSKENERCALSAGLPGGRVSGTVRKNVEGQEVAATVRFGEAKNE